MNYLFLGLIICIVLLLVYRYFNQRKIKIDYNKEDQNIQIVNPETKESFALNYYDLNYYNNQDNFLNLENDIFLDQILVPIDLEWEINEEEIPFNLPNIPENLVRQFNNNSQNVHDTFVQEKIKETHKRLGDKPYINKDDAFLKEIKEEFRDVGDVLVKIQSRNSYISNIDKRELEVLSNVWEESKHNNNIKENLHLQLKDCKDSEGNLVCGTGVVTRLTSSLYIENPEEMPKDKSIINTELLNKFSKLYNSVENPDKEKIKQMILNDYNETTKPKAEELINSWIDEI